MRIPLIVLAGVVALLGCKGKVTKEQLPATVVGSASAGSASAGSAVAPKPTSVETRIPVRTNTPPNKTTAALTEPKFKELAEKKFETFKTEVRRNTAKGLEVRHTTMVRPFLAATIQIQPCFDCIPMELAKWQAKEDALKALWPKELWTQPGSVFEPGVYDFSGQPMIGIYQVGMGSTADENDNPTSTYANAYILHYNDGINSIRVAAEYRDMPMKDIDALKTVVHRETLEQMARAFMDSYTHAW